LAKSSQTCTSLRYTGLSGVHQTVSGAQVGAPANMPLSVKTQRAAAKIHRTIRCAPDCTVSQSRPNQRSATRSTGDTWTSPTVERSHRTIRCATGLSGVTRRSWLQRSASPEKEGNHALFTVRWCNRLSGAPTNRTQLWPFKWSSNGS
jgi:hypothetical protein